MTLVRIFTYILLLCTRLQAQGPHIDVCTHPTEIENEYIVHIHIPLEEAQVLYEQSLTITVDHPDITLDTPLFNAQPDTIYDPQFKTVQVFKEPITIMYRAILAKSAALIYNAHIHMSYQLNTFRHLTDVMAPLNFMPPPPHKEHTEQSTSTHNPRTSIIPQAQSSPLGVLKRFGVWIKCTTHAHLTLLNDAINAHYLILACIAFMFISTGLYFLYNASIERNSAWSFVKNSLGIVCIAVSIVLSARVVQDRFFSQDDYYDVCDYR